MDSSRLITLYKGGLQTRNQLIDLSGSTNLFGSLGSKTFPFNTPMGFIPLDGKGTTLDLKGTNVEPRWLDLSSKQMQFWAYCLCSPLAAVIDRLAQADTNGRIEIQNEDGTTKTNVAKNPPMNRVINLLKRPNPLQTWHEFNSQQVVLCKNFGYCPVFALGPSGLDKTYTRWMFNISPKDCTPIYNENFDIYSQDGSPNLNPIKEWIVTIYNRNFTIPASDVMLLKDSYIDQGIQSMGLPISKVAGLDFAISNICAAMEADNVLLKKKGPLGVFSHDPKPDIAGWTPMDSEEKDDLQDDLKRYGLTLGQLQYIVSKTPIKWNAMSFNLRDLMTKETARQGIDMICDRMDYPAELMSGKNATYENRSSAEKFLYQNNIIPFSLRRMARYDEFFGITGLTLDYDHLPVLQEDIMKAGQAFQALSAGIQVLWSSGLLTFNQCMIRLDEDTKEGMDIYYNEYIKKYPAPVIQLKPKKPKADAAVA